MIPTPNFREELKVIAGGTEDIIKEILRVYRKYLPQLKEFSKNFQVPCKCPVKVAEKIWWFLKQNLRYQKDPKGVQYIKSPARALHDGFGDCKTFSIVAMSILHHLGIKAFFRFTTYNPDRNYHHVYVVIPHGNDENDEIKLDATWHSFNSEKLPYIKKLDVMPDIYEVSGIEGAGMGEIAEIANASESVKAEIRKELENMKAFLDKYSQNEKEKQLLNDVITAFDTAFFEGAILKAIENSEMDVFYTTILRVFRGVEKAQRGVEIGALPLAAGVAVGRGVVNFVRRGGLKKVGNVAKNVFRRKSKNLSLPKGAKQRRGLLGRLIDKAKSKIKQVQQGEQQPEQDTTQEQAPNTQEQTPNTNLNLQTQNLRASSPETQDPTNQAQGQGQTLELNQQQTGTPPMLWVAFVAGVFLLMKK
ncbi:transglutaminase domain-containing protein [Raineya orbicola]|uniref:Transglutaminase-like domain-containing protein n=1 Tax=Raineya orbicola TaxID=2016530 RepID=A0A2N3I6V7_9BACT|nr:transglutaminase domain-containing protein [Raineya orbicola]PKQ66048.1 hypothetical protein Rain11_2477 [Raineya orbicola]